MPRPVRYRTTALHPNWKRYSCLSKGLIDFALVEEFFLRFKGTGVNDPESLAVRAVNTEHADPAGRNAEIHITSLNRKTRRTGQQPYRKRILEGFLDFLQRKRGIQVKRRIVPVKVHK